MAAVDWTPWLRDFNRELLERLDLDEDSAFRDPRVTSELVAGGWLGSPRPTRPRWRLSNTASERGSPLDPPAAEDLASRSSPSLWRVARDAIRGRTS